MEALFLSCVLKKTILLNIVISLVYPPSSPFPFLVSLLFCQVEFKMKKADAIRWEKLEGEGQESNIKHFNPSQSTSHTFPPPNRPPVCALISPSLPHPPLIRSLSLSAKINISSCVCLFCTKRRVGSQALLEPFISLTAKVGRENGRYDSKI